MERIGNHGRRLDGAIGIPDVLSTEIGEDKSDGVEDAFSAEYFS
jgi:hypothetical protein